MLFFEGRLDLTGAGALHLKFKGIKPAKKIFSIMYIVGASCNGIFNIEVLSTVELGKDLQLLTTCDADLIN